MRAKFLTLVAIIVMTAGIPNAFAILNIYVDSNPYVTPGYDPNTTSSGIVEYRIYHESGSNESLSFFNLKFDTDVFSSFSFVSALIDGTTSIGFTTTGNWLGASGFSMAPGSSMILRVAYSFAGGYTASTIPGGWPEGGAWGQSFVGASSNFNFFNPNTWSSLDGGSSGLAPEPGTVMLLGSGLLGLGLVRRYLQRPKKL